MNPTQSPAESTRLGNMAFTPAGVSLDVEGRPVWIRKDNDALSVAALQAFHRVALGDYQARHRPPAKPGWVNRLRRWLGRVLGGPEHAGRDPRMETRGVADPAAPADAPEPKRARPAPASHPEPAARTPEPTAPAPTAAVEPSLRAVFADPGGIHLVWQRTNSRQQPEETETICALDSRVADSLQDCYGHLARLGYKVIGVDLQPVGSPGVGNDGAPSARHPVAPESAGERTASDPNPHRDASVNKPENAPVTQPGPGRADGASGRKNEAREQTIVMRLNPEIPEQPNRALVSPVDSAENTQILVAPERLLRSLRAAADPARPAEDRLTYLRCAMGKSGLKVVDVGLGEGKENSPGRWAEVSAWSAEQADKGPNPRRSQTVPVTAQAPDPELNLSL